MYKGPYVADVGPGSCIQKGRHVHEMEGAFGPFPTPEHPPHQPRWWVALLQEEMPLLCFPMPFSNEQFSTRAASLFHTPQKSAKSPVVKGGSSVPLRIIIRFAQLYFYWNLLI